MTTNADLQAMIKKVSALLATADSVQDTNPEMAANYRAKAEDLQRKYRIEEEQLLASDATAVEPEYTEMLVVNYASKFRQSYINMAYYVIQHAGVEATFKWVGGDVVAMMVGYPGDLRMCEVIFNAARLVFQEKLEPQVDPKLTDQQNVWRLREAGVERERIGQLVFNQVKQAQKVTRLYLAECKARGVDPKVVGRSINAKDYRTAYAREFTNEIAHQLRMARDAADSTGGALVLHGREERVKEAFWTRFPELRPSKDLATVEEEPCKDCKQTKSKTGKCKAHRPLQLTAADRKAIERCYYSASAQAGGTAGRDAAKEVELGGVERAKRLEEGETTALARAIKSW